MGFEGRAVESDRHNGHFDMVRALRMEKMVLGFGGAFDVTRE